MSRSATAWLWLEWSMLLVAIGLFTISETYQRYVLLGLGLLAGAFFARTIRSRRLLPRTGLELPLAIFLVSAAIATWVAYDRPTAVLQFARILAAAVLFYSVVDSHIKVARWVASGFVLAAALLAVYWPIQHDFFSEPGKFAIINFLGKWINTHAPTIPGPSIHSNVGAGSLALAIPFGIALIYDAWERNRTPEAIKKGRLVLLAGSFFICTLIIIMGLAMTSSRGAWLGITATLGVALLAWIQRRWFASPNRKEHNRRKAFFWGVVGISTTLLIATLGTTGILERLIGLVPDSAGSLQGRPRLWGEGLLLIRDYFFTGSGLMMFNMLHSVYSLQEHVAHLAHVHNFFLEVWIEQGLLGLIAMVWGGFVVLRWSWQALDVEPPHLRPENKKSFALSGKAFLSMAGLLGLMIIIMHGMVDVVFYVERTLPLLGLPLGFAWLATSEYNRSTYSPIRRTFRRWGAAILLMVIAVFGLVYYRQILSTGYANAGAVFQTWKEMTIYNRHNFNERTLDHIRQQEDLMEAESAFNNALNWDPSNLTALQRLAAIELSQGRYATALELIERAWDSGHRDNTTRLIYSDALVANGNSSEGAQVVSGISTAVNRLLYQAWYRYVMNKDPQRAASAYETVLILEPTNQDARSGLDSVR